MDVTLLTRAIANAATDNDPLHVSRAEMPPELLDSYEHIRGVEREGFFNDKQVSLRDLYALRRGTHYDASPIEEDRTTKLLRLIARETGDELRLSEGDVSAFFSARDDNGDGVIQRAEFDAAAEAVSLSLVERPILWRLLSSECGGEVTAEKIWSLASGYAESYGVELG